MQVNASTNTGPVDVGDSARIRVKRDHFDLVMHMLGHTTNEAKATAIGMHADAVSRARSGRSVSDKFIAHTLATLNRRRRFFIDKRTEITFESLFEPVVQADNTERAA